jgi:hypothetical protein
MRLCSLVLFAAFGFVAVACEDSGQPPTISGPLTGSAVPAMGKVFIVWAVSSGSPDYAFKFGEGTSRQGHYVLGPLADPPAEALNRYPGDAQIGVGTLVLAPADVAVPDGVVTESDVSRMIGLSTRHAIIWKKGELACSSEPRCGDHWLNAFPQGLSCGRCVPAKPGESFDRFEKTSCDDVGIETASDPRTLRACNWT